MGKQYDRPNGDRRPVWPGAAPQRGRAGPS